MTRKALKIACIGEAMIELSFKNTGNTAEVGFAGDTLNTAIYMRRNLDPQHDVAFVSVLGTDTLSNRMLAFIESQNISVNALRQVDDRLPGIYAISTEPNGERSFLYWRENSAARLLFQFDGQIRFDELDQFDVLYFSAITLAILPAAVRAELLNWLAGYRKRGGLFAFDSNYRPRLWESRAVAQKAISAAWRICDIALPSLDDETELFGDADMAQVLARFHDYGVRRGVLKRGAAGPVPIVGEPDPKLTFSHVENVVDTTAAGDSFAGAFLAAYLTGGNLAAAMTAGHNCASAVIGYRGAIIPSST